MSQIYHLDVLPTPSTANESTFAARIKGGMTHAGLAPADEVTLFNAWKKVYPRHRLTRQAIYRWFKAKTPKIDIPNLYLLSDLLQVNARWLALGPPNSITKPFFPDPEISVVLDAYRNLRPELKDELRQEASKLLRLQKLSSRASPYS